MPDWDELRERWPDEGVLTMKWSVSVLDGKRRLSWTVETDPPLDRDQRVALLRQEADELEEDIRFLADPDGEWEPLR
jgi:hypothetical protein